MDRKMRQLIHKLGMHWAILVPPLLLGKQSSMRSRCISMALLLAAIALPVSIVYVALAFHPGGDHLVFVGPEGNSAQGFYPIWYEDSNGLQLEICVTDVALCLLEPPPNPPFDLAGGVFPDEAFYWAAEAEMETEKGGLALLVLALEAAFDPEVVEVGNQIVFGRVRIRVDNLINNVTYTVTHPYGVDEFDAKGGGSRGINFSEDIGGLALDFDGALDSRVGPFLTWDGGSPPAGFIGDPAIDHAITGSPYATNFFRIEGPAGSFTGSPDLCPGSEVTADCIETVFFAVMGKELARGAAGVQATQVTYETNGVTGNDDFINVWAISATGQTIEATDGTTTNLMDEDAVAPGQYFARLGYGGGPPPVIDLTNTAGGDDLGNIPVDVVTITTAEYDTGSDDLAVVATSSDTSAILTAFDQDAGLLGAVATSPFDVGAVAPTSISVTSDKGGADEQLVSVIDPP